MLTESVLLACAGGAAGLLFAWLSFSFLTQLIPDGLALNSGVRIDLKVFGFTLLLSLVTGIIFGLAPAVHATRVDLNEALKLGGGRSGAAGGHRRMRNMFVVVEIALALVLLIGAGLLIETFLRLRSLDIGVNPDNVLTLRTSSRAISTPNWRGEPRFIGRLWNVCVRPQASCQQVIRQRCR